MSAKKHTVIATFDTPISAQAALDRLSINGITAEDVTVMVSEQTRNAHFAIDKGTKLAEGAAGGGAIGGTLGAIAAGIAAIGAITIPGAGLFAAGPLIAALAGAGTGAAAGGLIGGLVGLGFDEHEAKLVEDKIKEGHIAIGVILDDSDLADKAKEALEGCQPTSLAA